MNIAKEENKYKKLYETILLEPDFKDYKIEATCKKIVEKGVYVMMILFIIGILLKPILKNEFISIANVLLIASLLLLLILSTVKLYVVNDVYKKSGLFNEKILHRFLKEFFPNYTSELNNGFSQLDYDIRKYVEKYNKYFSSNLIKYKLNNKYDVMLHKLQTIYETIDENGNRHQKITFSGLVGKVLLRKNIIDTPLFIGHDSKTNIKLDNEEFEEIYNVHATNEVDAYKILSPVFMETLIKINEKAKIDFLIEKNNLLFRLEASEFFDSYISEKKTIELLYMYEYIFKMLEDILSETIDNIENN